MTSKAVSAKRRKIETIVERAGGTLFLAADLTRRGKKISQFGVRKWIYEENIPQGWWAMVAELAGVDEMELYRVHEGEG